LARELFMVGQGMDDKKQMERVLRFLDRVLEQGEAQAGGLKSGVGHDFLREWLEEVREAREGVALLAKNIKGNL
jgi:fructose-1-phosphate kinase PfkB-like protein